MKFAKHPRKLAIFCLVVGLMALISTVACTNQTPSANAPAPAPASTAAAAPKPSQTPPVALPPPVVSAIAPSVITNAPGQSYIIPEKYAPKPEKYGGILKLGSTAVAARYGVPLNIMQGDRVSALFAMEWLFRRGEQPGVLEPQLATSWDLAPDNTSYTFHLRQGVKFSDGTDFNAAAVKWNFDKIIAAKRPQMKDITSVQVIDPYTVKLNITKWNSQFLLNLGSDNEAGLIISPTAFDKNGEAWANTNAIGTGPYIVKEYKDKQYIKWAKNPNYWQKGVPYLDEVHQIAVADQVTLIAALKAGEISAASIDFITAKQLQAEGKFRTWVSFDNLGAAITMNEKDSASVWSNVKMRQALEYAIDKEKITSALGAGFFKPVYACIKGIEFAGKPDTQPRKYDPAKAKQLMAEAGYAKGVEATLNYSSTYAAKDFLVALQSNLADVGIKINLSPVDAATFNQAAFQPQKGNDLRIEIVRGDPLYPITRLIDQFAPDSAYFPGAVRPQGFDQIIADALQAKDPKQVIAAVEKAEKLAYDSAMVVPIWTNPMMSAMDSKVKEADSTYGGVPYAWYMYSYIAK
jgi:peptide/nickel transport system substrate-binding protein